MKRETLTKEEGWKDTVCNVEEKNGAAKKQMVEENIGLVHMVLKRFAGRGYEMEDLFQIGAIGLMKAVQRFDPTLGYSFSTYAVPVIIGEIRRFLRDDGLVHISRKIKDDLRLVAQSSEQIRNELMREPTIAELQEKTGLSKEEIVLAMEAGYEVESLSKPIGTGSGKDSREGQEMLLQDKLLDERFSQDQLLDVLLLRQGIGRLQEEEQCLIRYRYLCGKTQMETAQLMEMNQVAVSRMEKKVLQKLRLYLRE